MNKFLQFQEDWTQPETPAYDIYPTKLKEPYRTSRYELGEQMYNYLGYSERDKEARLSKL